MKIQGILSKIKKSLFWVLTTISIVTFVLVFSACDDEEEYPSLKVVNELEDSWRSIVEISLIGYDFKSLDIKPNGGSQTFVLDKGMSGGYSGINVTVKYKYYSGKLANESINVNFHDGMTTTITLKGCVSYEGCPGIYLE